jgi:protein-disulfide isomerase
MIRSRVLSTLEAVANLAMIAAAIALVWHVYSPSTSRAGDGREGRAAVEDVEPVDLSIDLPTGGRRGAASAQVVLIEFSDYQCPFCARYADSTYGQIDHAFVATGRIQYAFHNYPLESHADALPAAVAAECAGEQGKY